MPLKIASLHYHVANTRLNEIFQYTSTKNPLEVGTYTLGLFVVTETLQIWEEIGQKYGQESKQFHRISCFFFLINIALSFNSYILENTLLFNFIRLYYCKQTVWGG